MNAMDVRTKCSIRGRVAFVLAIAERCVGSLKYSEKVYTLARQALDNAWKWEEGGQIQGDTLYSFLENPDEESLAVYEWDSPQETAYAFLAITSAMAYVVWHAYRQVGAKAMPTSIHEVSDDVLDQVVEYGMQSSCVDSMIVDHIVSFLISESESRYPNDLGEPIEKQSILTLVQFNGSSRSSDQSSPKSIDS